MPGYVPEVTAQKVYMIHCEDCGMLYINNGTADPNAADGDRYPTTTGVPTPCLSRRPSTSCWTGTTTWRKPRD